MSEASATARASEEAQLAFLLLEVLPALADRLRLRLNEMAIDVLGMEGAPRGMGSILNSIHALEDDVLALKMLVESLQPHGADGHADWGRAWRCRGPLVSRRPGRLASTG